VPPPVDVRTRRGASRWSLVVTAAVAVGAAGFALLPDVSPWERIGGAAVSVMCAALVVAAVRALSGDRPLLVLRDEGIEHRWMGLIPWDDVDEVRFHSAGGSPMLGIELRDAGRYRARIPSLPMRLLAQLNPILRYPTLSLPLNLLSLSADELIAEMEARARRPLR
jgi:hypothetical protein